MDASVNRIPVSKDERALLISLIVDKENIHHAEESLNELKMLVKTAGATVSHTVQFTRKQIDPSTLIGKGQCEQLKQLIIDMNITLVVFDLNNIKPSQIRNLEEMLKCRVVGRTEVILDIFARRAKSAESKIQVELAQLRYLLPRLKGLGGVLSRLGGGIGTRGPGEKMLESDRRHIVRRISMLKRKLQKISNHRRLVRASRKGLVRGAVVGYTNAGKSTLINVLAKDDLFVEDRLFATLDAYTRAVYLDEQRQILLTDTVGFIRNLPAHLVESFKSTLEEITESDFLIHVVDVSARDYRTAMQTVKNEILNLQAGNKPTIVFYNKIDRLKKDDQLVANPTDNFHAIYGSALTGEGIDVLKRKICEIYDLVISNRNVPSTVIDNTSLCVE
ncbi:MAG: GTPase HflX [Spirochaetes bacterium]|nr:GTPase HflX [Spirochaetota bacterium]